MCVCVYDAKHTHVLFNRLWGISLTLIVSIFTVSVVHYTFISTLFSCNRQINPWNDNYVVVSSKVAWTACLNRTEWWLAVWHLYSHRLLAASMSCFRPSTECQQCHEVLVYSLTSSLTCVHAPSCLLQRACICEIWLLMSADLQSWIMWPLALGISQQYSVKPTFKIHSDVSKLYFRRETHFLYTFLYVISTFTITHVR